MSHSQPSVTLIGLGSMGATLARSYLAANYNLSIWNRTTTRPVIKELVDQGATFIPELSDALKASPITVFNLVGYDALDSTLDGIRSKTKGGEVLKGKYVVNLTNGTPNQARAMAEWMNIEEKAGLYVDGGIMATPEMIALLRQRSSSVARMKQP